MFEVPSSSVAASVRLTAVDSSLRLLVPRPPPLRPERTLMAASGEVGAD